MRANSGAAIHTPCQIETKPNSSGCLRIFRNLPQRPGDGAVDEADRNVWVKELKGTWFGDANLDGVFNVDDLLLVFQHGQYDDQVPDNAGWLEGDWNGDGTFGSSDFVAAFQDGGFELGPRVAANSVPEPSAVVLILLGIGGLFGTRKRK